MTPFHQIGFSENLSSETAFTFRSMNDVMMFSEEPVELFALSWIRMLVNLCLDKWSALRNHAGESLEYPDVVTFGVHLDERESW
jgi:hypothetical protein